jgi:hypothetical protein
VRRAIEALQALEAERAVGPLVEAEAAEKVLHLSQGRGRE